MSVLLRPGWQLAFLLFAVHQCSQYCFNWSFPLADAYLDPLLFLPVLLGLWLAERQWLWGQTRLTGVEVIVAGLGLALLGEELFPRWQPSFVRDWWDYPAYALGALWFWRFINPTLAEGTRRT